LPVRHSQGARARFTLLVSCGADLAVHSCPLLCLQAQAQPGGAVGHVLTNF